MFYNWMNISVQREKKKKEKLQKMAANATLPVQPR